MNVYFKIQIKETSKIEVIDTPYYQRSEILNMINLKETDPLISDEIGHVIH